jgi:hypothetical protein
VHKLQITKLWNEAYFTPVSDPAYRLSDIQLSMAKTIHYNLLQVMKLFPDNRFYRDMGLLLAADRTAYEKQGRVIPETSDLAFGEPVALSQPANRRVFGREYSFSVGALQVTTEGPASLFDIFKTAVVMAREGRRARFGDIAYYAGGALAEPAACFSNSRYFYYDSLFLRRFFRVSYTASYNGGVTVNPYLVNKDLTTGAAVKQAAKSEPEEDDED